MSESIYANFREWQHDSVGESIYLKTKQKVDGLILKNKPSVTVQLEGRSLLQNFPLEGWYYHVSEDANIGSPGYSIEAEQGFMPFPDQSVDLLIVANALELYTCHKILFTEIERVLATDGVVFISMLSKHWLTDKVSAIYYPLGNIPVRPMSVRKLKKMLNVSSLAVKEEYSLMSNKSFTLTGDRLAEQIVQPYGLEVVRCTPDWNSAAGVI